MVKAKKVKKFLNHPRIRHARFSKVSFIVFVIIFAGIGAYILLTSKAAVTPPGVSTAVCSPSPCTQGTAVVHSMASVADSDGPNAKAVTGRTYYTERPNNLVGAAPLLVLPGSPADTTGEPPFWEAESVTGKYELLFVSVTLHAGQPALPTTLADITAGANNCGTSGTSKCDDMPYLKAALDAVLSAENIDSAKVYIAGSSKAGTFSETAICDVRTSSYFHGAVVISSSLTSNSPTGSQTIPPACPAITGNANTWDGGQWGGGQGLAPNTDLSVMWAFGTNDGVACPSTNTDCEETGGVNAKGYWGFSNPQLAGDANPPSPSGAAAQGNLGIGRVLGCSGTPSTNLVYGTTNKLTKKIYTNCTHANRATETLKVVSGGHAMGGLNGVDGLDLPGEAWAFLSNYGGWGSAGGGSSDTTPPSAPAGLTKTAFTPSSISLSWTASTDNVGVAGYDIYKNGTQIGSTASTSYTIASLTCGTSYNLAVEAFDSAGNKSAQTSTSFSTSACPPASIPGDINGDGKVDLSDLAILLTHYGWTATASQGDLNGDGKVSLADLAILLSNFGR